MFQNLSDYAASSPLGLNGTEKDDPSRSTDEARLAASVLDMLKGMSPWSADIAAASQAQTNATDALSRVVERHLTQVEGPHYYGLGDMRATLDSITATLDDHAIDIDAVRATSIDANAWSDAVAASLQLQARSHEALSHSIQQYFDELPARHADQFSQVLAALETFDPSLTLSQDTPLHVQLTNDSESKITAALESMTLGDHFEKPRRQTMFDELSSIATSEQRDFCDETNDLVARIGFGEGQVNVDPSSVLPIITALEDQFDWQRDGSGDLLRVALAGYASATGITARNNELAEQRADNVKQVLVEKLFGLTSPQNGNADGPAFLSAARLIVLADGMGQALDGIDQVGPRRVDVSICRLSANSTVADATPQDDNLPPTSEEN